MVLSPFDAEDVTQEVLIKVITNLSKFEGKSQFRTWLYKIVVNHILNMKKRQLENIITTFDNYYLKQDFKTTEGECCVFCSFGTFKCLPKQKELLNKFY